MNNFFFLSISFVRTFFFLLIFKYTIANEEKKAYWIWGIEGVRFFFVELMETKNEKRNSP